MKLFGINSIYTFFFLILQKKGKMRRIVCLIVVFILFSVGIGFVYVYLMPYYTPAEKQRGLKVKQHNDDTIRIAYIGDSWADGHKNTKCVIDSIVCHATEKPVVVRTAGISGLTSKNIYYGIFRNDSMKKTIEWGPDFCFVVAGINDSDRKMGKRYYKYNMKLIIEFLLDHQITPIILEIPSFDIRYSFKRRTRRIKLQYLVSMFLTWSEMDCIYEYRQEYVNLLEEQGWKDKVVTIWSDDWNSDGYRDMRGLYDEGLMHLNKKGYLMLDSCIATKIIKQLNSLTSSGCH